MIWFSRSIVSVALAPRFASSRSFSSLHFDIDPGRKHNLINGLDDIGLTLEKAASIDA
jgi:3-isopropylmalate dehydratase small subunit